MTVPASRTEQGDNPPVVDVRLLGRFAVAAGELSTATWPRPSARRLCQLVLVSPGRRISRDAACDALFPALRAEAATNALWKALSMARSVLGRLGPPAAGLLCADHSCIWAAADIALDVDLDAHEQALRAALRSSPGQSRDCALVEALSSGGVPLEDEPVAEWADRVRGRLADLRQEARLQLARDRARGVGRARPEEVQQAWQACLEADPTCEEAASSLMRLHAAHNRRPQALAVYERCAAALGRLGLKSSPALEELRASVDYAGSPGRPAPAAGQGAPTAHRGEERRLLSVAVVELSPVGLGIQADPEDVREIIGVGLAQAISEVEALGGTVASISGSSMTVLFGAPQSHEDDPERALRVALRMVTAVGSARGLDGLGPLKAGRAGPGVALSVRIGVETGVAVVGPAGGGDGAGYQAVGGVVGAAAALQAAAQPSSVLVGAATRAATEGIFEWGPSLDVPVSPGTEQLPATYLVQPRVHSVAEAGRHRLAAKAPLVGRDAELAVLTEAVRATVSGRGGAVVVVGEPGLGKTRLVAECRNYFMGWVGAASGRLPLWLEGRCASYASSTPYGAYQQLLSRFIGAPLEAGEAALRSALDTAMRAVLGNDKEPVALLARMLGLPAGAGRARLEPMGPAELQHMTFLAMRSVLARLVEHGPTVLALEDLHWSDPTSLRLTGELATLAVSGPLLVLVTRRPEPDPGVGELQAALAADPARAFRVLQLVPLEEGAERALARSLLGGTAAEEVLRAVCQGGDGNPLFLEERLASMLDTGALERDGAGWRLGLGDTARVPEALERLIRSRTDRLSPAAREAIVAASVLGDEAERSAIGAVCELDEGLDAALSELVSGALLTEAGNQHEALYRFRHALIREATYHGLLRSQRRQLHRRAAWHLEASATGRLEETAAVLGRHFAAAGEDDRAVHYLELAGDHADQIFAHEEAIASYRQALAVINADRAANGGVPPAAASERRVTVARICEKLADLFLLIDRFEEARSAALAGLAIARPEDVLQAGRLQFMLGWIEFQQFHFDAALAAFAAAEELIGVPGLDDDQEWVELWVVLQVGPKYCIYSQRGELDRSAALIESARPLAEARGRGAVACEFSAALATQHLHERRYRVDEQILEELRRTVDAAWAPAPTTLWFLRPERYQASNACYLGWALTWHGDLSEARGAHERGLASAERAGSPGARGALLGELAITAFRCGDVEAVRELLPEARAAARGVPYHLAAATALQAWVAWRDDQFGEALTLGTEALKLWHPHPGFYPYCLALWPLAGAYLGTGQNEQAIAAARRLLDPSLARLPDELETAVLAACEAWDAADPDRAGHLLADAVQLARDLGYA
ncbi:MAG TPA: AAA family ATPase [Acidimicrobiales bacterium]|nr:AAA family ATPase [Acidimicrobiales bacterium]